MTKFHDANTRPPRGGWHYPVNGERLERYSEGDIIEAVRKVRINNGTFTSVAEIEREIWTYYASQQPERIPGGMIPNPSPLAPLLPRAVTKELQGPPIWTFLNTLAVQWTPAMHDYFLATCDAILSILDCPDCRNEWLRTLTAFPPTRLATKLEACQWVNKVHNAVNSHTGKGEYPYSRMVTDWGAPSPTT